LNKNTRKISLNYMILVTLLMLIALFAITPFAYMLITSLRQTSSLDLDIQFNALDFTNYSRVVKNFNLLTNFKNSLIVTVCSCLLNAIIASMAAYGFAKKNFPGNKFLFNIYLITLMIPGQVTLIPVFTIMRKLNMLNTYPALIIPILNAFGVFLIKQFMESLPDELLEAARIDGCSEFRIFYLIVIPIIKPVLVSLTVFTFITSWNDFIWPLVIATDSKMHTLTLAISTLKGSYSTNYGLVMAGSTIAFLPPFILYIFLQKQFIEGIAMSGIKG